MMYPVLASHVTTPQTKDICANHESCANHPADELTTLQMTGRVVKHENQGPRGNGGMRGGNGGMMRGNGGMMRGNGGGMMRGNGGGMMRGNGGGMMGGGGHGNNGGSNWAWLNVASECPSSSCGLQPHTQNKEPLCYDFSGDTPRVDQSEAACNAATKPSGRLECPSSEACTSFCSFGYGTRSDGNPVVGSEIFPNAGSRSANLAACQAACIAEPQCVAFDFIFADRCSLKSAYKTQYTNTGSDMIFYWSNRDGGQPRPSNCVPESGGVMSLPCTTAIEGCLSLDSNQLSQGMCSCATCESAANCQRQASGASCACLQCDAGYVITGAGTCGRPSLTEITATVTQIDLGANMALMHGWSMHLSGSLLGGAEEPRQMQSASCPSWSLEGAIHCCL